MSKRQPKDKFETALKAFIRRYAELYPEYNQPPKVLPDGSVQTFTMPPALADQLIYEACDEADVDPDDYQDAIDNDDDLAQLQQNLINHVIMGGPPNGNTESPDAGPPLEEYAWMLPDGNEQPYNAQAYFERGIVLMRAYQFEAAMRNFGTVCDMQPDDWELLAGSKFYRGCIKADLGQITSAIEDVEDSLTLSKKNKNQEKTDAAERLLIELRAMLH